REDTTHHASLFIGDLSPEVSLDLAEQPFAAFPSLSECRVMYDPNTGRSRGYGFASFGDPDDAHRALSTLNGEWLGSRPLRINWANQKHSTRPGSGGSPALDQGAATMPMSYEQIVAAAPSHNTTVYLGNLHPMTTQQDIVALFSNISFVREVRLQAERGYGFAVLDSHDAAATAIFQLGNLGGGSGVQLHGRVLRVSWGKDRNDGSIVPQLPGGGLAAG
ncbi:RNA-binding domain-containing protein, partial [Microstroma glucosiphilum]